MTSTWHDSAQDIGDTRELSRHIERRIDTTVVLLVTTSDWITSSARRGAKYRRSRHSLQQHNPATVT